MGKKYKHLFIKKEKFSFRIIFGVILLFGFLIINSTVFSQTVITVGASGANYTTIETAYNTGIPATISGAYIIELQTDYNPSSESYPINLPQKTGASSSNTITIRPASGVSSAFNITANVTTPIFKFDNADYVIIDGRPGGTGTNKYITIENINTSTSDNVNAIQFINDATYNVITYCTVKGSMKSTAQGSGVISFSSAGTGSGNDYNTIQYCNLTAGSGGRPYAMIYAFGTSTKENNGNIIEYNNFYDHFAAGASSHGINIGSYTNDFIIRNNSFYETTILTPSGAFTYYHVALNGTGNIVSNNYFGGRSAECGGAAMEIDGGTTPVGAVYKAIYVNAGSASIQGNTIKNINLKSSSIASFYAIQVNGGSVNIGTETGNTIGSSTGNGSIYVTSYSIVANTIYGINLGGAGTINASNNSIGSITAANISASHPSSITAIYSGATSTQTINNNNIGSTTTSNSIYSSSNLSAALAQAVRGIYCAGTTAAGTISGNNISNLTNAYTGTTNSCGTYGIAVQSTGNYTITNNTISYLYNASLNTAGDQTGPLVGIAFTATGTTAQTISGNTINNLYCTNTGSGAVKPAGIFINGPTTGTNNVYNNFIHSISLSTTSTSAQIYGIRIGAGSFNYYNNIVNLGTGIDKNINIYGIYENGSSGTNNLYFNTVYIGGTFNGASSKNTYALYNNANTNTRNFRNNILVNSRSYTSSSVKHYALYLTGTTNLTLDYNDYYVTGSSGVLGYNGGDKTTLPIVPGQDANSKNVNPEFTDPDANGNNAADFQPASIFLDGAGVTITGFTTDYSGYTRPNPPSIGGIEVGSPMPVQLTAFTHNLNGRDITLKWITSFEENNAGFDIERANTNTRDNIFEKIGFVKGNGTINIPSEYNFTDSKLEIGEYKYRLKQIDYNGNYEYFELDGIVEIGNPTKFSLSQNYPNPFNPVTKIDFELPEDGKVSLIVFDILGKEVMKILNEFKTAGYYTETLNVGNLSSGIYIYRLASENSKFVMTKKMMLIK